MSSVVITLIVIAAAVALGIALAYVPMRLLLAHIANNVKQFIARQRDRRDTNRDTPDRRKEEPKPVPAVPARAARSVARDTGDRRQSVPEAPPQQQ